MNRKSVKEQVLDLLYRNKGSYRSGEELAAVTGVSRTAVWKAINVLRSEGYRIEGTNHKGYTLLMDGDLLRQADVESVLSGEAARFFRIHTASVVTSTNDLVRDLGISGEPEGYVLIAEEQTAGKGRQGRSFYSPKASGVYLSLLLRPTLPAEDAVLLTVMAAAAAADAVEELLAHYGESGEVRIKWVNDLYLCNLKIAGILTEATLSVETGGLGQAVLGIGFNLKDPEDGWGELKGIAGSIFEGPLPEGARARLAACFLNHFRAMYGGLKERSFLEGYRSRQFLLGRDIEVLAYGSEPRPARAVAVDDSCRLLVEYPEEPGVLHPLNSGEVRVKATDPS